MPEGFDLAALPISIAMCVILVGLFYNQQKREDQRQVLLNKQQENRDNESKALVEAISSLAKESTTNQQMILATQEMVKGTQEMIKDTAKINADANAKLIEQFGTIECKKKS